MRILTCLGHRGGMATGLRGACLLHASSGQHVQQSQFKATSKSKNTRRWSIVCCCSSEIIVNRGDTVWQAKKLTLI